MAVPRRLFLAATICAAVCFTASHQIVGPAVAQTTTRTAPTASEVQVDLLRGLADIFSHGMDTLAGNLNRMGYSARVYSTHGWQSVAARIAGNYSRGHKDIVVIIGHSLGANAALDIAHVLDRQNIPIELIVTFDATSPRPVPKNVLHLVNFIRKTASARRSRPARDFKAS